MTYTTPTLQLLAHAAELCAMRQSVYAANIANAAVEGYRRLDVVFDRQLERFALASGSVAPPTERVVQTDATLQLDQEMALMAQNALRYQTLVGAFEGTMRLMQSAIHEGRE